MDITLLFAFLTTTLVFVAVPGPSAAFASAQALRHGNRGAIITVAGDALGTVVHITIAASSLAILISLSDIILPPLQIFGGLFLLILGYKSFKAAWRGDAHQVQASGRATFWAEFFTCVSNPKAIVFFVALFPAFISPDHGVLLQTAVYGAIFLTLDAVSLLGFTLVTMHTVRRASSRWLKPEVISGMGLTGVGLGMITKGYRALPQN